MSGWLPPTAEVVSGTIAATEADGANVALGATTDTTAALTVIGRLKNLLSRWPATLGQTVMSGSFPVTVASDQSAVPTQGNIATGATESGNPLGVGGRVTGTAGTVPNMADGTRGSLLITSEGAMPIALSGTPGDSATAGGLLSRITNNASRILAIAGWIYNGTGFDRARGLTITKTKTDASVTAGTGVTLWTPAAGKKPRILAGQLSLAVAGQIILSDNTVGGTELLRSPYLPAGSVWSFDFTGQMPPWIVASANNVIKLDVSATGNVGGWIGGTEE